jgi:hypothetical protein
MEIEVDPFGHGVHVNIHETVEGRHRNGFVPRDDAHVHPSLYYGSDL